MHCMPGRLIVQHGIDCANAVRARHVCAEPRGGYVRLLRFRTVPERLGHERLPHLSYLWLLHRGLVDSNALPGWYVQRPDWAIICQRMPSSASWILGAHRLSVSRDLSRQRLLLPRHRGRH